MTDTYDPPDELHLEAEIRLKQYRPRPSQVDIEAIARLANSGEALTRFPAVSQERVGKYSTPQFVGTLAASWVCGVVVGAACIYFSMASQRRSTQDLESIASFNKSNNGESESTAVAVGGDPIAMTDDLQFDLSTEPLQVGMSLRSRSRLVRASNSITSSQWPIRSTGRNPNLDRSAASETSMIGLFDFNFSPPSPMTKAELMKALLQDSTRSVH